MKKIIKWTSVIIALAAVCVTVLALIPGKNAVKTVAGNLLKDVFASAPASESAIPGDVDGNGIVNIRDSARLLLYIAGKDVDCLNAALDADGNGIINNDDASAILKSITGWNASLSYGDPCAHALTSYEYVAPTCTDSGKIAYFSCDTCGKLFKDEECVFAITSAYTEIAPDGHVEAIDSAVEPTCGTCGYTEGSHCAVCGVILEDQKEIEATGDHDFSAIGNEWIGTANFVQSVCAVCRAPSGVQFEGGFSEETNTLMLRECGSDFTFDIVCSENESYIRENLTVVESMFSSLEGELLDAFANEYELEKLGGDVWRVSPAKPYDERMGYDVLFDGGIELADFPGRSLSFRTSGSSSDVEVYRNDILFLRDFENRDPGYYPYTISFDEDAMQYTLTVSKAGIFTEDLIGRVLCVGECINMETASNMSSDEVDIGKITAIETTESGAVITLGPVDFTDIYAELDVTLGDKEMTVTETLTEEERMLYAAAILTNESFLAEINTVQMAAQDYAATYGAVNRGIDWDKIFIDLKKALIFDCNDNSSAEKNSVIITIGIVDYTINIPLTTQNGTEIAEVSITITLKSDYEVSLDGEVSKTNIIEYLKEKINIFEEDYVVPVFYTEINTKNTVTFNFSVGFSSHTFDEPIYYLITPTTATIHYDFCKYPRKYADDPQNYFTMYEIEKMYQNPKDYECKVCMPFSDYESFVINVDTGKVHLSTCVHVRSNDFENKYYSYIRPQEGAPCGKTVYSYCKDCGSAYATSKTFEEYMKSSLENSDWERQFNKLKERIGDKVNFELPKSSSDTKKVKLWVFEIGINISPTFSFNAKATAEYSYVNIDKRNYVFELVSNSNGIYYLDCRSKAVALTKSEKQLLKSQLSVTGSLNAEVGVGVTFSFGPAFISEWLNLNLYTEAGIYTNLRGIMNVDFINPQQSFVGGYAEAGVYILAEFNYTFFTFTAKDPIAIIEKTYPISLFIGDNMVYYGFTDYEQEINLGNQTDYLLSDSILSSYYYNLENMCAETAELTFLADPTSGYKLNISICDKNRKSLGYCKVADGILYVSDSAPEKFEAYMYISVLDTDNKYKIGDEPGVKYQLPELTVKIIYDSSREPDDPGFELGYSTGLEYRLNSDGKGYTVTGIGKCKDTEIVIPQKYMGLPVTDIGNRAFEGNESIIYVALPDGLTHVGNRAFYGCAALERVDYPESLEYIGDFAGYGCDSVYSIYLSENIRHIGVGAFAGCDSLSYISVSNYNPCFTVIGNCLIEKETQTLIHGFAGCNIPTDGSVTKIGSYAFDGNSNLQTIKLPLSITAIESYAFRNCTSLTSITFKGTEDAWSDVIKGSNWNEGCARIEINFEGKTAELEFTLAEDGKSYIVTGIGYYPFKDVVVPATYKGLPVSEIGNYAFSRASITSVIIPDTVTIIREGAFFSCYSLETVKLSKNITTIESEAFRGCDLTKIELPNGIISIGDYAFAGCGNVSKLIIPESVTEIGKYAFYGWSEITELTIPGNIQYFGESAFSGCSNLSTVTLLDGVPFIAGWAFANCEKLTDISIPESVTHIGGYAFRYCSRLRNISIPKNITSIEQEAFLGCYALENVYITDLNAWNSINFISAQSNPMYHATQLYLNNEPISDVNINVN